MRSLGGGGGPYATAVALGLDDDARFALAIAARTYGAGEMGAATLESAKFDPLARLGVEERSHNAKTAAALLENNPTLRSAAEVLRARSEWFDGTGKPLGLRHQAIPTTAGILAATIAYDALERAYHVNARTERGSPADLLDSMAGTQFDPKIVRAFLEIARARA